MQTCYHCGRAIKGAGIWTNPPIYLIRLGIDFPKAFHPTCYTDAEKAAAASLHPAKGQS